MRHTTERARAIQTALRVLCDPTIPWEHEDGDHNCGDCASCIMGTIGMAHAFRREAEKVRRQTLDVSDPTFVLWPCVGEMPPEFIAWLAGASSGDPS